MDTISDSIPSSFDTTVQPYIRSGGGAMEGGSIGAFDGAFDGSLLTIGGCHGGWICFFRGFGHVIISTDGDEDLKRGGGTGGGFESSRFLFPLLSLSFFVVIVHIQ